MTHSDKRPFSPKVAFVVGCLMLLSFSVISLSLPARAEEIIARVNGEEITRKQLSDRARIDHLFMTLRGAPLFAEFIMETGEGQDALNNYRSFVLDKLIRDTIVLQRLEELGLEVTEKEVEARLNRIVEEAKDVKNKAELVEQLEGDRQDLTDLKEEIYRKLAREKVKERVVSGVEVESAEIKEYYEENKETFRDVNGQIRPLKEVKGVIKQRLRTSKEEEAWREWLSRAWEEAKVEKRFDG